MKIKTYTALTMSEAMDQVRRELGENAIIVSTQRLGAGAGVRLTAAIEESPADEDLESLYGEPHRSKFRKRFTKRLPITLCRKT